MLVSASASASPLVDSRLVDSRLVDSRLVDSRLVEVVMLVSASASVSPPAVVKQHNWCQFGRVHSRRSKQFDPSMSNEALCLPQLRKLFRRMQ